MVDPGCDRDLVPKVSREAQHAHAVIALLQATEDLRSAIVAAVVDVHDLERQFRHGRELAHQFAVRLLDDVLLVVAGHDDADQPASVAGV